MNESTTARVVASDGAQTLASVMPGQIQQVAYVHHNLREGIESWLNLGIGPWFVIRNIQSRNIYRGKPQDVNFSVAFSNSGALQLEIIQPDDDGPSIFREFLDSGREGFHHVAWWASNYEATLDRARRAGLIPVFSDAGMAARYTYFDPPLNGQIATALEVVEINERNRGLFDRIRGSAEAWKPGERPIRHIPAGLLGLSRITGPGDSSGYGNQEERAAREGSEQWH